ncbi:hypothetical protein [Enterococcus innesii]|nr:hypothetical protein [Enterococcus innesii]
MVHDIYVVLKRWDYENTAVMKAFVDEEDAKEFVKECFESGIYGEGHFYIEKSILAEGNSFDEFVIQEKVKIPLFVSDLVNYTKGKNRVPADVLREFFIPLFLADLPVFLDLRRLKAYFDSPCHRYAFEKACILGYELEQS